MPTVNQPPPPASSTAGKVRKRIRYAITYEFEVDPPETLRGEIDFLNEGHAARTAVKLARLAFPRRKWSSLVILLDRSGR